MSLDHDPLAPPPGYGQAAGRSHAPEEPAPDFTMCCTGCGLFSAFVMTLGCTAGEHVGEFGYCATHSRGPFWCGRCQQARPQPVGSGKMVAMRVLKQRWIDGQAVPPAVMQSILDKIFDGEEP